MIIAIAPNDFAYQLLLFLHILAAIVGFGSTFVWPFLAAKSRAAGPDVGLANSRISMAGEKVLTTIPILVVGATGLLLVLVGEEYWVDWSDGWISISLLLYLVALGVAMGLHGPNLARMLELQEELASGSGGPPAGGAEAGGPPPQVVELGERGRKAQMYGGILHLLFVAVLVMMVFKPGGGGAI